MSRIAVQTRVWEGGRSVLYHRIPAPLLYNLRIPAPLLLTCMYLGLGPPGNTPHIRVVFVFTIGLFSMQGFCGGAIDAIANAAISVVHGADVAPWMQVSRQRSTRLSRIQAGAEAVARFL